MLSFVARLMRLAFNERRGRFFLIFFLDALSALAKIISVLVIALAVRLLSLEPGETIAYRAMELAPTPSWVFLLGLALGVVLVAGAGCAYGSAWLSRRLGRQINEKSMADLYGVLRMDPGFASDIRFDRESNINVLLTQVPIHTGLAVETVARLVNPLILLAFAGLSLLLQQPIFTLAVGLAGLVFLPVLVRFSIGVQSTARAFYSTKAMEFSTSVGSNARGMINQHGIVDKSTFAAEQEEKAEAFFSAYDSNLLANERVAWIISFADGILRALVFVVLCLLVLRDEFTAEAAVLFLGALAYALMSARQVASLTTNLLRYHPQAERYFDLVGKLAHARSLSNQPKFDGHISLIGKSSTGGRSQTRDITAGKVVLMGLPEPVSVLSIGRYSDLLFGNNRPVGLLVEKVAIANGSFQFAPITVLDQLCANIKSDARKDTAVKRCIELGAHQDFMSLHDGYDTMLSDQTWRSLGPQARVALRLVPLAIGDYPIVLIDIDVLRPIGGKAGQLLREWFGERIVYLTTSSSQIFADLEVDIIGTGNEGDGVHFVEWADFPAAVSKIAEQDGKGGGAGMLETLA